MIASVLLLMIGTADVVRSLLPSGRRWSTGGTPVAAATATALAVALLSTLTVGLPLLWALVGVSAVVGWTILMPVGRYDALDPTPVPPLWPAFVLLALIASVSALDHTTVSDRSGVIALVGPSPRALLSNVSAESVLAGLAVAVALTQTANIVVRAVLGRNDSLDAQPQGQTMPSATPPHGAPRWTLRIGRWAVGEVTTGSATPEEPCTPESAETATASTGESSGAITSEAAEPADHLAPATMRGGRHIGPIERILLVTAAVAGAYPVIAGLFAAKGIVRFPEIANDRPSGGKAEEFLVGSMASWLIAALGAGYLVLVSRG